MTITTQPAILDSATPAITITPKGAIIDENASAEEAIAAMVMANKASSACQFAIGDIAKHLQGICGVQLAEIAVKTGINAADLSKAFQTCDRIPYDSRTQLTFALHAEAAKLPELPDVSRWLELAEENDLSRKLLRKSIELDRIATKDDLKPVTEAHDGGSETFGQWLNRVVILDGKLEREGRYAAMDAGAFYNLHRDFMPTLRAWARFVGKFQGGAALGEFERGQFQRDLAEIMELSEGKDRE